MRIGIIGGTGAEGIYEEVEPEPRTIETDYGPAEVFVVAAGEREIVFLPRHRTEHDVPPHRINYRANIRALADLECFSVIATNAVGSLRPEMQPGDFVLPDQFLDFTRQRPLTFHDGNDGVVRHVDVTVPYCPRLRDRLLDASEQRLGASLHPTGTYVCCEGPRFETPAEIQMFAQLGGDVVGMTGVPEVVLAREAGLCYATVCVVTNYAAGSSPQPLTHAEVTQVMEEREEGLRWLLRAVVETIEDDPDCPCRRPFE